MGITTLLLLAGLVISALAPGNLVRQSDMWKIPAWKAILKALLQGIRYAWAWMRGWWLLAALLLTPFFWQNVKKNIWRFRYPLIVIGFVYGIFCSMSCPTFYTMNSTGPARAVAIVYYSFILATFFCYYYLLGWIYQSFATRRGLKKELGAPEQLGEGKEAEYGEGRKPERVGIKRGAYMTGVSLVAILLIITLGITGELASCTTIRAINVLATGEARAYELEYRERLRLLEDEKVTDVVLKPFVYKPDMLYVGDLSSDSEEPTNQKVAQYFGKNSVAIGAVNE